MNEVVNTSAAGLPAKIDTARQAREQQEPVTRQALKNIAKGNGRRYSPKAASTNEHYTPEHVIEAARQAMGGDISLDPASCEEANEIVKAERILTEQDSGLDQPWKGDRLWLNPPFSSGTLMQWVDKTVGAFESGDVKEACLLLNQTGDTKYGQKALRRCTAVCFPAGRLKFYGPGDKGGSLQVGQMIMYYGSDASRFAAAFGEIGVVLVPHGG